MNEWKKLHDQFLKDARRATDAAESVQAMVEARQRRANQFRDALKQAHALRFTELQRQADQLAEAQKRAAQCVNALTQLTAPYRAH